jgi:hypothetical protein
MPRVVGGAVLAAAAIVNLGLERSAVLPGAVRGLLILVAAGAALWLVRAGSEARMEVEVRADRLELGTRGRRVELSIDEIEAIDFDPAFSSRRRWLPAVVLVDRRERRWRIPASVERGGALIDAIVERSGQDRLRAWSDARRIPSRMVASRWLTGSGYVIAVALVAAAAFFVGP